MAYRSLIPLAVTGSLIAVAVALRWQGRDLPSQLFRAELIRRNGFGLWNGQWYGGHPTLDYSVIVPALGAVLGPVAVGAMSAVVSTVLFNHLAQRYFGQHALFGSIWFAAGTVCNVIVGRITFACGLAFALAAVVALAHRALPLAALLAAAASLTSPVAGVGALLAVAAWTLSRRENRGRGIAVGLCGGLPLVAISVLFPTTGWFPYEPWAFGWDLAVALVIMVAIGPAVRTVALAAAAYSAAAAAVFLVANPLGGNISRFGQFFAGPLLACALSGRRRIVVLLLAVPLLAWQWVPVIDTIASGSDDQSAQASYYKDVLTFLTGPARLGGRVEIPSTYSQWESVRAALVVPLARGGERQLDIGFNPMFYDNAGFDAARYQAWLQDNGVEYVALPDARLDDSSLVERALLLGGLPYLTPAYRDAHWTVWRFDGFAGLVTGPARVIELATDGVTLSVDQPGDVTLRVRYSPHWTIDGTGCIESENGWTRLSGLEQGVVHLTQSLGSGRSCPRQ